MTFTASELKRIQSDLARFMERRRPPVEVRGQVDLLHRIDGQSVVIYEIRPDWQDPATKTETPLAKATFVRTQDAEARTFAEFLAVVDRDELCCFFG